MAEIKIYLDIGLLIGRAYPKVRIYQTRIRIQWLYRLEIICHFLHDQIPITIYLY